MSEDIEKRKSFALFVALYETLEKQGCENVSSMIDQLTKNDNGEISDYYKELRCLKKQLTLTEKALELACQEITGSCQYCSYATMPECPVEADCVEEKIKYFKQQAEQEVENE